MVTVLCEYVSAPLSPTHPPHCTSPQLQITTSRCCSAVVTIHTLCCPTYIYIYLLNENSEFNEKATITGLRVEGVYRAHHTGTLKTHSHNWVTHTPVRIQSIRTNNLPITPHNARLLFFVYLRSRGFVIDRNLASNHGSCRICNLQVATLCQVLIKQQKLL